MLQNRRNQVGVDRFAGLIYLIEHLIFVNRIRAILNNEKPEESKKVKHFQIRKEQAINKYEEALVRSGYAK